MSVLGDIREAIRARLSTVTTTSPPPRLYAWDATASDLGANAITIGIPSSSYGKQGDPFAADVELGRYGWTMRWPITVYIARTADQTSTDLCDAIQQDIIEALFSDPRLGGLCVATALDSMEADDTDPDEATARHVLRWEFVTTVYRND